MDSALAVRALGALSQETRLAAFRLLVRAGPDGLPAGRIAESLDVALPTLSFHLKELAQAGLVTSRSQSRFVIYTADFDRMSELLGFLTENCCRGVTAAAASTETCCAPEGNPA